MKSGNPFGPFWDELGVDFDLSEFTGLGYDVNYDFVLKQWQTRSVNHSILQYTTTYCSIEFQYSVTLSLVPRPSYQTHVANQTPSIEVAT